MSFWNWTSVKWTNPCQPALFFNILAHYHLNLTTLVMLENTSITLPLHFFFKILKYFLAKLSIFFNLKTRVMWLLVQVIRKADDLLPGTSLETIPSSCKKQPLQSRTKPLQRNQYPVSLQWRREVQKKAEWMTTDIMLRRSNFLLCLEQKIPSPKIHIYIYIYDLIRLVVS